MASPLRIRESKTSWTLERVRRELYRPLEANIGAAMQLPWFRSPEGFQARRFEMDNGDVALFCWNDQWGYWVGNTETPKALWKTDKVSFGSGPETVTEWFERELLAQLHEESPWLEDYPAISWFFLPVFLSKDGRHTTRAFFREHAAGFPDTPSEAACQFYDDWFSQGILDEHRFVMSSKLGTSAQLDLTRMTAAMGEFDVAMLLSNAGNELEPEAGVTTGHSIDFRVSRNGTDPVLVEVTRPLPPSKRVAGTPAAAIKDTAATKTEGQLQAHGGGVSLFVDCSSFPEDAWRTINEQQPDVGHRPAVVFRMWPSGRIEGYTRGSVPVTLGDWRRA